MLKRGETYSIDPDWISKEIAKLKSKKKQKSKKKKIKK